MQNAHWRAIATCLLVPILGLGLACESSESRVAPEGNSGSIPILERSLEEDLPQLLEAAGVPGLAIAVVKDGVLKMDLAVGVANRADGTPVTTETVFEAASLSKPVLAVRALQLVEEGVLDLDRPLTSYMEFEDVQNDDRVNQITARHVLSHSTGFPNWSRDQPLSIGFDPGSQFSYSGEGFVFLQRVIETLTGNPFHETVQEHIFAPLGMQHSSFIWRADFDHLSAVGHDQLTEPREKWKPDTANAAASLHTTASDYARFLAEIANPTLLSPETVREMLNPQIEVTEGLSWGLGWGLEQATSNGHSEQLYWHWGDNGVFRCVASASADRKLGVVYFTNSENGFALADEILRRTLDTEDHPWLAWQGYPSYDSPTFRIQSKLLTAGIAGEEPLREAYSDLADEYPADSFSEAAINNLGYGLLQRDAVDSAVALFDLNVQANPDSWNTYDSLAEAYMIRGDTDQAIANYQRSLDLNPDNKNAETMLIELSEK